MIVHMTDRWIEFDGKYISGVVHWRNDLLLVALKMCTWPSIKFKLDIFFDRPFKLVTCLPYLPNVGWMLWR